MDKNFKLIIEYDGTNFHGWQRQKKEATIQGEIEKALWIITRNRVTLNGSGRTDAGVHAFELMNAGHPDIPDSVRAEMLRLERQGRIRLVSSTDWHGWGGYSRTWTLLRVPGAAQMTQSEQAQKVVQLLREGQRGDVIPVVAGYQGEVHPLRVVFSPLVEFARYAAELSPTRLLGWWLWGALLWLLALRLRAAGINQPGRVIWAFCLLLVGLGLFWKGVDLYRLRPEDEGVLSDVTEELGSMAMQAALPLIMVAGWLGWHSLRITGRKR